MKKENEEKNRSDQVETDDQINKKIQDSIKADLDFEDSPEFKKILSEDEKYLDEFQLSMEQKGLSKKTIQKHLSNVAFFLEDYLLYYEAELKQEGVHLISSFLGDYQNLF